MTLQGGLGDIVSGMKNIAIPGGDSAIDQLTGIRHHNNRDVWIVMRKHAPVTYYISYRITPMGITAPVISPTTLPTRYEWMLGHLLTERGGDMKISQDGRFLVCTDSLTELCNFNDTTGVVTPKFKFYVAPMTSGAEFSLDSKYLYLCTTGASGPQDDNRAWQFDLAYQDP